ncbi:MAG: aminopeptidase P family protein [Pseudomonadota bacterium]
MSDHASRLASLRSAMRRAGCDALFVPRADEYLGEYIPANKERLRWLTGFTGSAGMAIIGQSHAAMFVDGRYTVQVRAQVDAEYYAYCELTDAAQLEWLTAHTQTPATLGYDPRLHSERWRRRTEAALQGGGLSLTPTQENLLDLCWEDRPDAAIETVLLQPEALSGESSRDKRHRIARDITERGYDASLLYAPDTVSWLLNLRGTAMPQMPVVSGFALLKSTAEVILFSDPTHVPEGFADHVGSGVRLVAQSDASEAFAEVSGLSVLVDDTLASAWVVQSLRNAGANPTTGDDPVMLPKARKNATELQGARAAHRRDAVAEIGFLTWLDEEVSAGRLHDEAVLADKQLSLRVRQAHFHASSFDTISAAGPNAAMCHYNHLNGRAAGLPMNSIYLNDSGGHYRDGTTDITRCVAIGDPGPEIRRLFTLVLKGHMALARARFPVGTTGSQLDVLARQFLWQEGLDYAHGTGHGVGAFLSVHEGPQRISKLPNSIALQEGMIVSDEPGYYRDGAFGMRCENLLAVSALEGGESSMLGFEVLTLVPFDRRLIDATLLDAHELDWLNAYHERVLNEVGPLLEAGEQSWLQAAVRPIDA